MYSYKFLAEWALVWVRCGLVVGSECSHWDGNPPNDILGLGFGGGSMPFAISLGIIVIRFMII